MSRYLSALKVSENIAVEKLKNLKNLPLTSLLGSLGAPPALFEIKQAANDNRTEALQAALVDPDSVLSGYMAITEDRGLTPPDGDDRRTCRQCANLRGDVCLVASPGGAVSANRGYRPAANLLQRCDVFEGREAR